MYVRQTSDPSDPNLLMECLARGPSNYSEPIINWFILYEDGIGALKLDQSGLNYIIYENSVSDNYRKLSALQLLQNSTSYTFVCEAVDGNTGSRKATKFVPSGM